MSRNKEILYEIVSELFEALVEEAIELDRKYLEAGIYGYGLAIVRYVMDSGKAYEKMKKHGKPVDYYALLKVLDERYRTLSEERKAVDRYLKRRGKNGGK